MKQSLRYFSLGLFAATLSMLVYYYFFFETETVIVEKEQSTQEMIEALTAEGYYISDQEHETTPQVNENNTSIEENDLSENDEETEESTEPSSPEQPDQNSTDEDTPGDTTSETDNFILSIQPGMTITEVANYLMVASLIDSRDEFVTYLYDNGYGTNIQIGEFELNRDMSLDEVVETIATKEN